MATEHSFVVSSYCYNCIQICQLNHNNQFEPLERCSGHVEKDCGDQGETLNTCEYNEYNLETQVSLAHRMK